MKNLKKILSACLVLSLLSSFGVSFASFSDINIDEDIGCFFNNEEFELMRSEIMKRVERMKIEYEYVLISYKDIDYLCMKIGKNKVAILEILPRSYDVVSLEIPDRLAGFQVTQILKTPFFQKLFPNLRKIKLPCGLDYLGDGALNVEQSLEILEVPDHLL